MKQILIKLLPQIFSAFTFAVVISLVPSLQSDQYYGSISSISGAQLSFFQALKVFSPWFLAAAAVQLIVALSFTRVATIKESLSKVIVAALAFAVINTVMVLTLLRNTELPNYSSVAELKLILLLASGLAMFVVAGYCFNRMTVKSWFVSLLAAGILPLVALVLML